MQEYIEIKNAKVHNLKNISVKIPKNKLVVITGVSGSGKSSLAFDTLYAEGQRRYVESLSSYARQFLGLMEKPDVESIIGLSPAISIDQKTSGSNPRSTVGTITEIYDYLRLLYGHIGVTHCPNCNRIIQSQTINQITNDVISKLNLGDKLIIISPIIQGQKGQFKELLERLLNKGFLRVIIDNENYTLDEIENINLDKNIKHNIDLVIDRLIFNENNEEFNRRLTDAVELSTNMADGEVKININDSPHFYSENNTCFECKISFPKIKPASFSFNSPHGACTKCAGLGTIKEIDIKSIYNPKLSILEGGIFPWSNKTTERSWTLTTLQEVAKQNNFDLKTHIGKYPPKIFNLIFYGDDDKNKYTIQYRNKQGLLRIYQTKYEGVIPQLERLYKETTSEYVRSDIDKYMIEKDCNECNGKRLQPYSLAVRVNGFNIDEITSMQISKALSFFKNIKLEGNNKEIAKPILKEIISRLQFLEDVGLDYLSLNRKANTLSGGESQRIRLASQIGTGLTGVLYVLDEPSIGLHSKDVNSLIKSLKNLRDIGNSVVIVEHDYDTIKNADWIIDVGPEAGNNGGQIVAQGTIEQIKQTNTLTARYINKSLDVGINIKNTTKNIDSNKYITLFGVKTHNLKSINVRIPLNKLVTITGVSGSGKSSLVNDTLSPILHNHVNGSNLNTGVYESVEGLEYIDKVIGIDQSPIGKTPRSNPSTYTNIFTSIREIFSNTPESRSRGYTPSRFSFNVKGGRCEKCKGDGQIKIEMQFLPDMYVTCDECNGKRYNKEALQIDYKGKNISEVLDMTVNEASIFFSAFTPIKRKLQLLSDVGLGYITLGQSATTLSGGESQRIKLAKELSKVTRGHTIYILDEPTTGLHFHDVDKLLTLLKKLVDKGNTVLVIEHNMDIIKHSDWIIDMGPEGGDKGGKVIFTGTVQEIIRNKNSYTGIYLKRYLDERKHYK